MSPRSSAAVTSTSTGSRGVAANASAAGHLNATGDGAVVSAVVGSRCDSERATSSLRVAAGTCSRPNPNTTVSAVERAKPPACVCVVLTSSSIFSWRSGSLGEMPVQLRSRVGDFARGALMPLASSFGSLPEPASGVNGAMPLKMLPVDRGDRQPVVRARAVARARAAADDAEVVLPRVVGDVPVALERGAREVVVAAVVLRVEEARQLVRRPVVRAGRREAGPAGRPLVDVAAGDDRLAALVEVVAHGDHRLVGPARQPLRAALLGRARQVPRVGLRRVLRDEVVTRVPEDRVEVRQHAEERRVARRRLPGGGRAAGRRR